MTKNRDVEAEAISRAPLDDKYPAADANAHYRVGFREGAAWATEDVITIPRTDLPDVKRHTSLPNAYIAGDSPITTHTAWNAEYARERGLGYLAIADFIDANPPIDEAQVDALAKVLYDATSDPDDIDVPDVARRLVKAGVRAPKEADK